MPTLTGTCTNVYYAMKKKSYERKARLYNALFCANIAMVLPSFVAGLICSWYELRTLSVVLVVVSLLTTLASLAVLVRME